MKPWVKWTLGIAGGVVALLVLGIVGIMLYVNTTWDSPHIRPVVELKAPTNPAAVQRGEYLFKYTHACWDCHSPKRDATVPPSGGREFDLRNVGPGFGIYYAPNITLDEETGIGKWTDGQIVRALREGMRLDGKALFPLMPIEAFRGLSDDDALSIVAYIRTITPVRNQVPKSEPSFTLKALFTFGMIKPEPPITEPIVAPKKGVTVEYGKYLANHAAGCMDCHTPRNLEDGSFYRDSLFAGSTVLYGQDEQGVEIEAYARNITGDEETGIGRWTEEQFLDVMRSGMRPDGTVLSPYMPYAYYGLMEEEDLKAIFLYLRTVPTFRRTTPPPYKSPAYEQGSGVERGKVIFNNSCSFCHGEEGRGAPPTRVVLAEVAPTINDAVMKDFVHGGNVGLRMPAFGKTLTTEQITDVVAYIRSWKTK